MQPSTPSFTLRPLAGPGSSLGQFRKALRSNQDAPGLVLLQISSSPPRFPPSCPHCLQPASRPLRIRRPCLLSTGDDDSSSTLPTIDTFDIPFCHPCHRLHQSQLQPLSPWTPLRRILFHPNGPAGLVVLAIAAFFLLSAIRDFSWFPLLLATLPLATGLWLCHTTWKLSRHLAIPNPTSVDLSADFSPSLARPFEPPWRAFLFRSPIYAELFRHANSALLWQLDGAEAQSAAARRRQRSLSQHFIVATVVAALLLWALWDEFLSPLLLPLLTR